MLRSNTKSLGNPCKLSQSWRRKGKAAVGRICSAASSLNFERWFLVRSLTQSCRSASVVASKQYDFDTFYGAHRKSYGVGGGRELDLRSVGN